MPIMTFVLFVVAFFGAFAVSISALSNVPPPQCWREPQQLLLSVMDHATCPQRPRPEHAKKEQFSHPIWSHRPFCVSGNDHKYCTHTTRDFRHGDGLSIIAAPIAAEAASRAFAFAKAAPVYSASHYKVQAIPGKGMGLLATRPIRKSEIIILDSPRIIASHQFPAHVAHSQGLQLFESALERLPKADQTLVLDLGKSLGGTEIEDVMKTNAFACQIEDAGMGDGYMCLFPMVSRINHACRPNAHAKFTPRTLLMEIRAQRNIQTGEEISIAYGRLDLKHAERQTLYRRGWGFTCTCDLCTANAGAVTQSDLRRERFKELRERLSSLTSDEFDPDRVVKWEMELLEISHDEGLEVIMADDLERLAYVFAGMGKLKEARNWASKARDNLLQWSVVDGGPDLDIRRVEELLSELG